MTPEPRLPPLARDQWDGAVVSALRHAFSEEVAGRFLATGPDAQPVPNAISTLLHHPALAGRWLAFNNVLLWEPALDPRLRELVVLRVAWRTQAPYEWVQHVKLARRYGIGDDEVAAIARDSLDAFPPFEAAVLSATDQLVTSQRVDDPTWRVLAERLDERQLVELVFAVGAYTCLAMAFNAFGIELEGPDEGIGLPAGG